MRGAVDREYDAPPPAVFRGAVECTECGYGAELWSSFDWHGPEPIALPDRCPECGSRLVTIAGADGRLWV